jgi:hypothetical protein
MVFYDGESYIICYMHLDHEVSTTLECNFNCQVKMQLLEC